MVASDAVGVDVFELEQISYNVMDYCQTDTGLSPWKFGLLLLILVAGSHSLILLRSTIY